MPFIFPPNTELCSCGSVKSNNFCANCNTGTCSSCREEGFWVKHLQSCSSCGEKERTQRDCPSCTMQPGFQMHDGRPHKKGILTSAYPQYSAQPTLIPIECTTCNCTGRVWVPVTNGFSSDVERKKWHDLIVKLRTYTQEYKQAQRELAAQREKERRECELAQEALRKESSRLAQEKIQKKITETREVCQAEIQSIRDKITKLVGSGTPEVKARYSQGSNLSNRLFKELMCHFHFIMALDRDSEHLLFRRGFGGREFELNGNAQLLGLQLDSANLFQGCFAHQKKREQESIRYHFRLNIDSYPPSQDYKESSYLFQIAKKYSERQLNDILKSPCFTINLPVLKGTSVVNCIFSTLSELLAIRNEVWNESWWNRNFQKATTTHYNQNTDRQDAETKRRLVSQIEFMQGYWTQSTRQFVPPLEYENYPQDLQRIKAEYEYYSSLQLNGRATFAGQNVDALSSGEMVSKTKFRDFSGNYQPSVDHSGRFKEHPL